MKTRSAASNKINIVTLGCSKNLVDSEVLLTQLQGAGLDAAHEAETGDANVVVVNTCGFIDRAKEQSIQTILDYAEQKTEGAIDKLFVTGCLSERYRGELTEEFPEVDGFYGTMDMPDLLARFGADYKHELVGERRITTDAHYAYLKIAEGCNRPCSFCAIPLMRGKHRSRAIEDLAKEAAFLASRGVKELMLIAQDLTYYGLDLYGARRLADLLKALSDVEGLRWIRLHYAYPSGFPADVLPVIRERANICNYLDMPLQHISDHMLKAMRRGITRQKTYDLVARIRDEVPGIALRTTLLVGYPGETEQDFEDLLRFIEETKFERLGVFQYSHEENTHAYQAEDDVPAETKAERAERVMELQREIAEAKSAELVGRTLPVLIDRYERGAYIGRTEYDSPEVDNETIIQAEPGELTPGAFYDVRIESADAYDYYGAPVHEPA